MKSEFNTSEEPQTPLLAKTQEGHEKVLKQIWENNAFGDYIDSVREKREDFGPQYQAQRSEWIRMLRIIISEVNQKECEASDADLETYYEGMIKLVAQKNRARIKDLLDNRNANTPPTLLGGSKKEHKEILLRVYQQIQDYAGTRRHPEITIRTVNGLWAQLLYEETGHPYFERLSNPTSQETLDALDFSVIQEYKEEALHFIKKEQEEQLEAMRTRWEEEGGEEEEEEEGDQISERDMKKLWEWGE